MHLQLEVICGKISKKTRPAAKGGPGGKAPPGLEKFTSVPPTEMNFIYTYTYVYMCVYIYIYIYILYILAVPPFGIQAGYGPEKDH